MVRIDIKKLERQCEEEHKKQLEARGKCFRNRHSGKQEFLYHTKEPLDFHFQFILSSSGVFEKGWEAVYRCSSCGWVYHQLMTPDEIRELEMDMDKIRYAQICVSA